MILVLSMRAECLDQRWSKLLSFGPVLHDPWEVAPKIHVLPRGYHREQLPGKPMIIRCGPNDTIRIKTQNKFKILRKYSFMREKWKVAWKFSRLVFPNPGETIPIFAQQPSKKAEPLRCLVLRISHVEQVNEKDRKDTATDTSLLVEGCDIAEDDIFQQL